MCETSIIIAIIALVLLLTFLLLAAQQEVGEALSMDDFNTVFQAMEDITKQEAK